MIGPGTTLRGKHGTYLMQAEHGRGGFGVTWRAVQQDGRPVLLKSLRLDRMEDWKALQLFEREAQAMQGLSHPAVPAYIDYFGVDASGECHNLDNLTGDPALITMVIVQQFIPGENLETLRRQQHRHSADQIEALLRTMLQVLNYLHNLSPPIIHRDITPKNIVRAIDGNVFLVDFGAIQNQLRASSSLGSTSVGTFGYIPPEQALGRTRPASDLYALAMSVVVTATGLAPEELPLDEQTGKVSLNDLALALPANVVRTLDAMLEPVIGQRIASAAAALTLLDEPTALAVRPGDDFRAQLLVGRTIQLGRAASVDLRISDPSVSRYHAAIVRRGPAEYIVRDLSSARGTRLNGRPIKEAVLNEGDALQVGTVMLAVRLTESEVILTSPAHNSQLVRRPSPNHAGLLLAVVAASVVFVGVILVMILLL